MCLPPLEISFPFGDVRNQGMKGKASLVENVTECIAGPDCLKELSAHSTSGILTGCGSFVERKHLAFEERVMVCGSARGHLGRGEKGP